MIIVSLGWLLFRVQSFEQLITMLNCYHNMEWLPGHLTALKTIVVLSAPIFILEWFQLRRNNQYVVLELNHWLVSAIMAILICLTLAMFSRSQPAFIYFQF